MQSRIFFPFTKTDLCVHLPKNYFLAGSHGTVHDPTKLVKNADKQYILGLTTLFIAENLFCYSVFSNKFSIFNKINGIQIDPISSLDVDLIFFFL